MKRNDKIYTYMKTHEYLPLIICTILTIILYPYIEQNNAVFWYHILICLVLLSGLASIWNKKQFLSRAMAIWALSFILLWFDFFARSDEILIWYLRATFIFFVIVLIKVIASMLLHKHISTHVIYASIAWYLIIGMVWAILFAIIEVTIPWSFAPSVQTIGNMPSFLYYSFVSMLTIWYGDIAPVWWVAQMRSVMLAIVWQLYLTIVLGTLIGKYIRSK